MNVYNDDPVYYCAKCYSLKIKHEDIIDADYCADCGCSDIVECPSIEEWEALYEKKYNHKYVTACYDPQKTIIFNMSLSELKMLVYNSPSWRYIIKSVYPRFPKQLGKTDSVILFFDKLIKDNKIKDLKLLLLNIKF